MGADFDLRVEETPEFRALVDRVNARPAVIRAKAADAALAAGA